MEKVYVVCRAYCQDYAIAMEDADFTIMGIFRTEKLANEKKEYLQKEKNEEKLYDYFVEVFELDKLEILDF